MKNWESSTINLCNFSEIYSLWSIICNRAILDKSKLADSSWTGKLFIAPPNLILKKFNEECIECVIAFLIEDDHKVIFEVADLIYHMLVYLKYFGLNLGNLFLLISFKIGFNLNGSFFGLESFCLKLFKSNPGFYTFQMLINSIYTSIFKITMLTTFKISVKDFKQKVLFWIYVLILNTMLALSLRQICYFNVSNELCERMCRSR